MKIIAAILYVLSIVCQFLVYIVTIVFCAWIIAEAWEMANPNFRERFARWRYR